MMFEAFLAAAGLTICMILIVRLLLSKPRQRRFDARARQIWFTLKFKLIALWHWRDRRRTAQQAATDAINRAAKRSGRRPAEEDGVWKGNVYESKTFRKPRKPH